MAKMSFLVGVAAGYVLGARAGKQRYEQIKRVSNRIWTSEPVEAKKADLKIAAKTKAAPFVAEMVSDAAKATAVKLRESGTREPKHLKVVHAEAVDDVPATGTDD
jgi:hypothetical protein